MSFLPPGIKFSNFPNGGTLLNTDILVGLRNGVDTQFTAAGIAEMTTFVMNVTQAANTFVAGNVLRLNAGNYVLAQADNAADSSVVGIVSAIVTAGSVFTLQFGGLINLPAALTPGAVYFLDPAVPGGYTATPPATPGQIYKPLFIVLPTGLTAFWINYPGLQL